MIDENTIVEAYKAGLSIEQIRKQYGLSSLKVGYIIGKHGLDLKVHVPKRTPANRSRVISGFYTIVPRAFRDELPLRVTLEWVKIGEGEFKVKVIKEEAEGHE